MSTSSAVVTTNKMELTPMRVSYNGVDLGGTLGNVVVSTKYTKAEIKADQSGETVRDRRTSGVSIQVTTELTEIRNKDIWKVVFPHAREVVSGLNKQIYWEQNIGDSDLANSNILVLHPLSLANADLSGDYKFFLACSSAESEITYSPNEQGKLKIVWNILPDTTTSPERFFVHGDPTIGLLAASFTGPTYVGTGNGTMTGTTVYNGFTKTETITATLVTAVVNGGVFNVNGSVTGPMGLATVGVSFVTNEISFTINDGATDFVLGDQFTIPTTAANYS